MGFGFKVPTYTHTPLDSKLHSHTHVYLCECETSGACGYTGPAVQHQLHIFECVNAPLFNYFSVFFSHCQSLLNHLGAFAPSWAPAWPGVAAKPQMGSDRCRPLHLDFSPEPNPGSTWAWPSSTSAGFLSRQSESEPNPPAHRQKLQLSATVMMVKVLKSPGHAACVFHHLSKHLFTFLHFPSPVLADLDLSTHCASVSSVPVLQQPGRLWYKHLHLPLCNFELSQLYVSYNL